jgi:protein-tyrosine phosphatase
VPSSSETSNPAPGLARRIPLEGAFNFRDLGGQRTVDGRLVRTGLVFRADSLHRLTAADLDRCRDELGLRAAYDLRSDGERDVEPSALHHLDSVRVVDIPLISGTRPRISPDDGPDAFLLAVYRNVLEHSARTIGTILTDLADSMPAVFHCTAGKDRTGVLGALILLAVGVDLDDVLDDYELTSQCRSEQRVAEVVARLGRAGVPPEVAAGVMGTPRHVMRQALDEALAQGGVEAYLLGAAGMAPDALATLRTRLLGD